MTTPADTRARILAAAMELFCRKSYHAVGTQEICEAAGVQKGSMYHFFPSKLDVALAAVEMFGGSVRLEQLSIAEGNLGPAAKLRAIFQLERGMADRHLGTYGAVYGCLVGNMAFELATVHEPIRTAITKTYESWAAVVALILMELIAAGIIPPSDPLPTARTVISYLNGVVLTARVANDPVEITRSAERVWLLLGCRDVPG